MSAAASGGAAAAAERARRQREEEEIMTPYNDAELAEGWEFKILRSATHAFRKPDELRRALDEEARAGWVLVEKFDNERLRLKRPARAGAGDDAALGFDPYRTTYGMGGGTMAAIIVGSILGAIGLIVGVVLAVVRP